MWKTKLAQTNEKAAQSLANPKDYENLFPGLNEAIEAQHFFKKNDRGLVPAVLATAITPNSDRNLISEMKAIKGPNENSKALSQPR